MQKAFINTTRKTAEVCLNYGAIPANSLMETQQTWRWGGQRRQDEKGSLEEIDVECEDNTEDVAGQRTVVHV